MIQPLPGSFVRVSAILVLGSLWMSACGGEPRRPGDEVHSRTDGAADNGAQTLDGLRRVHARALAEGPALSDLEGQARLIAEACLDDAGSPRCRAGETSLSGPSWSLVQEVVAGDEARATARADRVALCAGNDAMRLRAEYPGHAAFLDRVTALPPASLQTTDAVVAIGHGSALIARARRVLAEGWAEEGLKVQMAAPGTPSGFDPGPGEPPGDPVPGLAFGWFTPDILERMATPRPDCERFRNTAILQGACRRDLTVSIVRDWMEARGHHSVRILLDQQTAWPEYDLLFERMMPGVERILDLEFEGQLSRSSSILSEMCGTPATEELWQDYRFYVRTLFVGNGGG